MVASELQELIDQYDYWDKPVTEIWCKEVKIEKMIGEKLW